MEIGVSQSTRRHLLCCGLGCQKKNPLPYRFFFFSKKRLTKLKQRDIIKRKKKTKGEYENEKEWFGNFQ